MRQRANSKQAGDDENVEILKSARKSQKTIAKFQLRGSDKVEYYY